MNRGLSDYLLKRLKRHKFGILGAVIFFLVALLWMILGFWRTVFIAVMTGLGYLLFEILLSDRSRFIRLLEKIFPEGKFR
ncbi:MAG: DUF2273 domain-containing protein [Eubacteriales bacterium]|nr:DUF2273 domain-containing protein [Eubacteriales bacterium]